MWKIAIYWPYDYLKYTYGVSPVRTIVYNFSGSNWCTKLINDLIARPSEPGAPRYTIARLFRSCSPNSEALTNHSKTVLSMLAGEMVGEGGGDNQMYAW
jgi:hypothetical protein